VDPVYRSTVDRRRGMRLLLIWTPAAIGRPRCHTGGSGGGRQPAAELTGDGRKAFPCTKIHGKRTKMKRRTWGTYREAWRGGRGTGGADPGAGRTPAAVLRRWRGGGVEELRGAVWFGEGARGYLYRAERGAEGARLRRCATGEGSDGD
jgi:hypothetical protein